MTPEGTSGSGPPVKVPVVVIVGSGRTGSTLLGAILGSVPGVFVAGEVRFLWERGLLGGRLCGCGRPVPDCPVWREVVRRSIGSDPDDAEVMVRRAAAATRIRSLPGNLWWYLRGRGARHGPFRDQLGVVYREVRAVSGAALVVDTSKLPTFVLALDRVANVDLKLLHLVRSPAAAVFSWQRIKRSDVGDGETMEPIPLVKSLALWSLWSSLPALVWGRSDRYRQVRYEDVMAEPRATLAAVAEFIGIDPAELPFEGERTVRLQPSHQVAGNVDRLRSGLVELRDDDEWRARMPGRQRVTVAVLAAPARAIVAVAGRRRRLGRGG